MAVTTSRRGLIPAREATIQIIGREDAKWFSKHREHLPPDLVVKIGGRYYIRAVRLAQWLHADGEEAER